MSARIGGTAAHRREHARQGDGRFGQQEYARASGVDLDGEGDLLAPRDAEAEDATSSEAWYDAGTGETVIETSSRVRISDVMGVEEGDPRFKEGGRVLHDVLESRYPEARVGASREDWNVQFTTRVRGRLSADEALDGLENDPCGANAFRADLEPRQAVLHGEFLRRMRASVLLPEGCEGPQTVDDEARYRTHLDGGEVAPPSDEIARAYANELSIDGVEISRLAQHGVGSAVELDRELAMCPRDRSRAAFRAHQLRRWAAIRHAETMRRWS